MPLILIPGHLPLQYTAIETNVKVDAYAYRADHIFEAEFELICYLSALCLDPELNPNPEP